MSGLEALLPVSAAAAAAPSPWGGPVAAPVPPSPTSAGFGDLLSGGLRQIDQRVASADALVRSFALDDNVPLHQVTFALEQARLSVELAMQVQNRLVEGYRQLMNMQL